MSAPSFRIGPVPSVDDVEFIERLGAGLGSGRFKARLGERGPLVSLLLASSEDKDRLVDWLRQLEEVNHPVLPEILRLEAVREPTYAAWEYIEGDNLEARVALRGSGLPELDALAVVLQAAAALHAAHSAGVAHGALNPRSVILVERESTFDGVRLVGWTPPRVSFDEAARSDLQALGSLLYLGLAGTRPPSVETDSMGLEGEGGAFDDILMDWVDLDRGLRGLGRPALDALANTGRYNSVAEFISELRPVFRERLDEEVGKATSGLDADREFLAQVERHRAQERELESKLRFVRQWLREHDEEIGRTDAALGRLSRRKRGLETIEVELDMLLDAPRARRRPDSLPLLPRRSEVGVQTEPGRIEPRVPDPGRPSRRPASMPPVPPAPVSESEPPAPAPEVHESAELEAPDVLRERRSAESRLKGGSGLGGIALALGLASLLGAAGGAWIMIRTLDPSPAKVAKAAPKAKAPAAVAPVAEPAATPSEAAPSPKEEVPTPKEEAPAGLAPDAAAPEESGQKAPQPEASLEPVKVPAISADSLPPPPDGTVAVPGGAMQPGLSDEQRAIVVEQCRQDLHDHPRADTCEDRMAGEPEGKALPVRSFYIDRLEVSQKQYNKCRRAKKCERMKLHWELSDQPATGVTQKMAALYCKWRGARLPTADEWLYAARGNDGRLYPWGDQAVDADGTWRANTGKMGFKQGAADRRDNHKYAAPVGVYADRGASAFGVVNMAGNVREWTSTRLGNMGVAVGGGWRSMPHQLRVTRRELIKPSHFGNDLGFRCVVDLPEE